MLDLCLAPTSSHLYVPVLNYKSYSLNRNEPDCGLDDSFQSLFGPISATNTSLPSTEETKSWGCVRACTEQTKQINISSTLFSVCGYPDETLPLVFDYKYNGPFYHNFCTKIDKNNKCKYHEMLCRYLITIQGPRL